MSKQTVVKLMHSFADIRLLLKRLLSWKELMVIFCQTTEMIQVTTDSVVQFIPTWVIFIVLSIISLHYDNIVRSDTDRQDKIHKQSDDQTRNTQANSLPLRLKSIYLEVKLKVTQRKLYAGTTTASVTGQI